MNSLRELWQAVWNPLSVLLGVLLGALANQLLRRLIGRMTILRWEVQHQHVAASSEVARFGRVQVLYNDEPVTNLRLCIVQLENESSRDLTDVEVTLIYSDGTKFLDGGCALQDAADWLPFTDRYNDVVTRAFEPNDNLDLDDPDVDYVRTHREYRIPVLNRGIRVNFWFLVIPSPTMAPKLQLFCVHPGVELREKPQQIMLLGVPQNRAIVVGLIIALALTFWIPSTISNPWAIAITSFLFGTIGALIGVLAIRTYRLLARLLT